MKKVVIGLVVVILSIALLVTLPFMFKSNQEDYIDFSKVSENVDDNIWLRRVAIDHQLLRKEKTDTNLLEKILVNNLNHTEFFINKAIGWALRDYSKTNPQWVKDFIEKYKNNMASLSIREASKYI